MLCNRKQFGVDEGIVILFSRTTTNKSSVILTASASFCFDFAHSTYCFEMFVQFYDTQFKAAL